MTCLLSRPDFRGNTPTAVPRVVLDACARCGDQDRRDRSVVGLSVRP